MECKYVYVSKFEKLVPRINRYIMECKLNPCIVGNPCIGINRYIMECKYNTYSCNVRKLSWN